MGSPVEGWAGSGTLRQHAALNNRSCKEKFVMQMLRMLFFIEAYHQFYLVSERIPDSVNNRADHLSRNQIALFHASHKTAKSLPSNVPSYSGYFTHNWIGHLHIGPISSVLLFKGNSQLISQNIPICTEEICNVLLHIFSNYSSPGIRSYPMLFLYIYGLPRLITPDH